MTCLESQIDIGDTIHPLDSHFKPRVCTKDIYLHYISNSDRQWEAMGAKPAGTLKADRENGFASFERTYIKVG